MWRTTRALRAGPTLTAAPATVSRRDAALAAVVATVGSFEVLTRTDASGRPAAVAVGAALAVAALVRRTRVLLAVAIGFGTLLVADVAAVALDAEPVDLYTGFVVLVLAYSLYRWGAGSDIALGTVLIVGESAVAVFSDSSGAGEALGGVAVLMFAAAAGLAVRYRAVAREHLVEQARAQERELLARELHDSVAHHVSAIATQAQAGLVLARTSPAAAAEALVVIEREAAKTLAEMRAVVSNLRAGPHAADPSGRHGLADIELLAVGADPPRVRVEMQGCLGDLTRSLESALYRVAQESVTNARRHAHGATQVAVTITGGPASVELTVLDDGARRPTPVPVGYGVVGMHERVALLGGTLTAGPAPEKGWLVHAILPRPGGPA